MIVVSNGFKNFHLVMAGAEANSRKILTMYIAGAYPTAAIVHKIDNPLMRKVVNVPRFIARGEAIDDELIRSRWLPELLQLFSLKMSNLKYFEKMSCWLKTISFRWYSRQAIKDIKEAGKRGAKIYHYRAGFGHESARMAKELGMITLCDHSIVHPETLQYMIDNNGRLPPAQYRANLNFFWRSILKDFEYADAILVNSEFVKKTFVLQGYAADRVHVAYLGVDAPFLKHVSAIKNDHQPGDQLRLMFAGLFGKRKGSDFLIESLLALDAVSWHLDIAGAISPYIQEKYAGFLNDERVNVLGTLSREKLAENMQAADVFVFPSLAEGSARVIFEAMACGCYVIATPNSGSVVESGLHGELVPPGDVAMLKAAILNAAQDIQRTNKIGADNARLVQEKYLQGFYGEQLNELYKTLIRHHDC